VAQTINPFSGQTYEIASDLSEPLIIENFDPTKDSIQLPANPDSEVIPQFSFSDRYTLTEIDGDTAISTLTGQLVAVIKGVTELKTFTGYTKEDTYSLVSLENEFFSTYIEPNFFEPWYLEFDESDYGSSVQKAIDAGLVSSAYEHYLKFGQFEAREDIIFAPKIDGNNTIYGSGYEGGLVGVPISEGVYTRDVKPITTGVGEIDTLIGAPGEDSFFLGNGTVLNETSQPFYVGGGDDDYALIKNLDSGSSFGQLLDEVSGLRESLTDRIVLAGKAYDYEFERVDSDLKISYQGDLIAIIEDAPPLDVPFSIPGATYLYTTGNEVSFGSGDGFGSADRFYEPFYLEEYPEVQEAIDRGEYKSAFEHYIKVGQLDSAGEVIFSGTSGDDFIAGFGSNDLLIGTEVTFVDGEKEGYRTASMGVGEADSAVGGLGVSTFVIGNDNILDPEKGGEVWYVGNGDEDYLTIEGFDPYKDFLFGAGEFADYSFEVIEETDDIFGRLVPYKSLEVNYQGDRVALLEYIDGSLTLPDITSLIAFPLGDERPNGLALVAPQNEFLPPDPATFFNESVYLTLHPKVQELIDNGEYESAYDYYLEVGEDKGHRAFLTGTAEGNDDITAIGDKSTLIGVEVTGYDKENQQFLTAGDGAGEIDSLTGNEGRNRFFLGEAGESFYLGNGDADYATIKNFDPVKDRVILGGAAGDYTYETVEGNFQIAKDGDLVSIVEGISDLKPFTGSTLEGRSQLLSLENQFFDKFAEPYFYADIYPVQNPDVDALIEAGEYTSYYDHFLKAGQFEEREDTFFVGTEGNDTLYALGFETVLVGVPISDAIYRPSVDVVPLSLGEGQIDTLYGGNTFEAIYVLGSSNLLNETPQAFYMGQGDADYALIKDFSPNDIIRLGDDATKFTQEVVDGNLEIAKDGDLIAIVENTTNLLVVAGDEGYNLVNAPTYIEGTAENDTLELSVADLDGSAIGVDLVINENYQQVATSTGVGEVDTFNFLDTEATNLIYLGFNTVDSPDTPQTFYLGNGDEDYALIKNFNPLTDHNVLIPGKFEDYEVEIVEGNTLISKEGDLVAIAEDVVLVPDFEGDGFTNLFPSEDEYFVENTQPFFNEDIYLEDNPDVADAIAADEYASGYQHFMRVGLLEGRDAYYNGTAGDEADIYAMGNSYVLGVPITGFDAATGQFTTATMGMGELDSLTGTIGVNKFVLGSNGESFYLGNGSEDSATVNSFDVLKDELILGGSYEDYTFTVVEENLQISLGDDLVATVNGVTELQEKMGDDAMGMFTLVAPEFTGVDPFAV
jgi:hypothetical protein